MSAGQRIGAGGALLATSVVLAVTGCGGAGDAPAPSRTATTVSTRSTLPCRPGVSRGVVPVWARAGFSERRPRMYRAVGRRGRIAALVFGYPLQALPGPERSNKILWVPRVRPPAGSRLRVSAQRMTGATPVDRPVVRVVDPGPSTVDVPVAGCWRLSLTWPGGADQLDVEYTPG